MNYLFHRIHQNADASYGGSAIYQMKMVSLVLKECRMPKKNEYKKRPPNKGGVQLRMWMQRQDLSVREMASQFDWNPTSIDSYILGKTKPSLDMANEIFKKTGVPMHAWCEDN